MTEAGLRELVWNIALSESCVFVLASFMVCGHEDPPVRRGSSPPVRDLQTSGGFSFAPSSPLVDRD